MHIDPVKGESRPTYDIATSANVHARWVFAGQAAVIVLGRNLDLVRAVAADVPADLAPDAGS